MNYTELLDRALAEYREDYRRNTGNRILHRSLETLDFLSQEERDAIFTLNKVEDTVDVVTVPDSGPGLIRAESDADCPPGTKCLEGFCLPLDKTIWEETSYVAQPIRWRLYAPGGTNEFYGTGGRTKVYSNGTDPV